MLWVLLKINPRRTKWHKNYISFNKISIGFVNSIITNKMNNHFMLLLLALLFFSASDGISFTV